MWRSGSASPCQGEGREFKSRHPLKIAGRPAAIGGVTRLLAKLVARSLKNLSLSLLQYEKVSFIINILMPGGEMVSRRPLEPFFQVRVLARQHHLVAVIL